MPSQYRQGANKVCGFRKNTAKAALAYRQDATKVCGFRDADSSKRKEKMKKKIPFLLKITVSNPVHPFIL
jgi:phosphoribosylanthranilate isomerase